MSMLRNRGEGPLAIICMPWSPICGVVVKGDRANAREVPPASGNRPSVGHGWRTPWGSVKVRSQNSGGAMLRSEEHTSELQSLMRISYAVFCLKKKKKTQN